MADDGSRQGGVSRRSFLKGVGAAAASAGSIAAAAAAATALEKSAAPAILGPGPVPCTLKVDGAAHALKVEPRTTLLDALRHDAGVTVPKEVCDLGACGACTVLLDGTPIASCMALALDADGREIRTAASAPEALRDAFVRRDALQCGFCTPGMVTSCAALLARNPDPGADEVRDGIAGNLCRCGTYPRVVEACVEAAAALRTSGPGKGR
jgi:xanthine dehydrogenase YagT iron-sulfur-binding subunit